MNKVIAALMLILMITVLALYGLNSACAGELIVPGQDLPDKAFTQGANAVDSTGKNIGTRQVTLQDLCHTSTSLVRNVPDSVKKKVFAEYHLVPMSDPRCTGPGPKDGPKACYEIDHDCSLEHGCSNIIQNLWPQRYDGTVWNAHVKDRLEDELHRRICAIPQKMTMQDAQQCISNDWISCYHKVFGK